MADPATRTAERASSSSPMKETFDLEKAPAEGEAAAVSNGCPAAADAGGAREGAETTCRKEKGAQSEVSPKPGTKRAQSADHEGDVKKLKVTEESSPEKAPQSPGPSDGRKGGLDGNAKYMFGTTAGPGAADIGKAASALPPAKDILNAIGTEGATKPLPGFVSKFTGATFGSAAASSKSIFGSAASVNPPFAPFAAGSASKTASIFDRPSTPSKTGDDGDGNDGEGSGPDDVAADDESLKTPSVGALAEQEVCTGEEEEEPLITLKGKLFAMENGQWRERGTGTLRLNVPAEEEEAASNDEDGRAKRKPRLVMRTDHVHRLILNATVFAGLSMKRMQEKFVVFGVVENGKPASYGFRAPSAGAAIELCDALETAVKKYCSPS